jgi:hypothetical protein
MCNNGAQRIERGAGRHSVALRRLQSISKAVDEFDHGESESTGLGPLMQAHGTYLQPSNRTLPPKFLRESGLVRLCTTLAFPSRFNHLQFISPPKDGSPPESSRKGKR